MEHPIDYLLTSICLIQLSPEWDVLKLMDGKMKMDVSLDHGQLRLASARVLQVTISG